MFIINNWQFSNYNNLIKLCKKNHKVISFYDYKKYKLNNYNSKPWLILRHDVELNLERALELAKIDYRNKIGSTFFFLFSSEYNIFLEKNHKIIKEIIACKRDIGIHYDQSVYEKENKHYSTILRNKIKLFENIYDLKISAISPHMPMRNKKKLIKYKNIFNAYESAFFKKIKYISDSNQKWRIDDINTELNRNSYIQLLLHENTWSKKGHNFDNIFIEDAENEYQQSLKRLKKLIRDMKKGINMRKKMDKLFRHKVS